MEVVQLALDDMRALRLMPLEALASRTLGRLTDAGVDALLLKGPVTNAWLYGGPHERVYGDVDVLVRPAQVQRAGELLVDDDFVDLHALQLPLHRPSYERAWSRYGLVVDLHTRLAGVPLEQAEAAFEAMWGQRQPFELADGVVAVLSEEDRAVHLALHAAQSPADSRALRDLSLGLNQLSSAVWGRAVRRAHELGCASAMCFGLAKMPEGRVILDELEVAVGPSVEVLLRARSDWPELMWVWEAVRRGLVRGSAGAAVRDLVQTLVGRADGRSLTPPLRHRVSALARAVASVPVVAAVALRQLRVASA